MTRELTIQGLLALKDIDDKVQILAGIGIEAWDSFMEAGKFIDAAIFEQYKLHPKRDKIRDMLTNWQVKGKISPERLLEKIDAL